MLRRPLQARVGHEVTRTRGAREVREDQVGVVARPLGQLQHVRADDGVAVQVERVVEEVAALENRAAVRNNGGENNGTDDGEGPALRLARG